jgi:hypothetical protein
MTSSRGTSRQTKCSLFATLRKEDRQESLVGEVPKHVHVTKRVSAP